MEISDDVLIDGLLKIYYRYRNNNVYESELLFHIGEVTRSFGADRIPLNSDRFLDIESKIQRYGLVDKFNPSGKNKHSFKITDKGILIIENNGGWIKYKRIEHNWFLRNDSKNLKWSLGWLLAAVTAYAAIAALK